MYENISCLAFVLLKGENFKTVCCIMDFQVSTMFAERRGSKKNVNENGSVSDCKLVCYISRSRLHNHVQQAQLCLT